MGTGKREARLENEIIGGSAMNKNQIGDMEHAIRNQNRFYTDANDKDWNDLVEKGYATKQAGWDSESAYYIPTTEGKKALRELVSK